MTPTSYQKPEIRDSNDNIISAGAFGKNTALSNATNDGWIDYVANDLEALNNGKLPLTGGTLTGDLNIRKTSGQILIRDTNITKGTAPANNLYLWSPRIDDTDGRSLGGLDLIIQTNKQTFTALYNYSMHDVDGQGDYIGIGHDPNGNVFTYAPTPANSDNSTKIATTAFVNNITNDKAPINSPAFSGTPTAPTPLTADSSTKIATTEFVHYFVPTGVVQAYAGTTIPFGWLPCDGSSVSRTTYAKLFSVIGTTYGAGDGSTTFNLPNLTDKFIQGSSTSGTEKTAGLPNITGTFGFHITAGTPSMPAEASGAFASTGVWGGYSTASSTNAQENKGRVNLDASRSSSVYGNSTTVQPPALTMKYIIKY